MGFVAAKCTQCGANIEVDNSKEAGICTYCNTAFITEKAINNYTSYVTNNIDVQNATINVTGADVNNLLLRAAQFEQSNENLKALDYYNKVLDIDAKDPAALLGVERLSTCNVGNASVSKSDMDRIDALIRRGAKIEAIKLARSLSGLGLKEAKDFVEARDIPTHSGENKKAGCYIATAVYESYDCPEVWILRRYRDYEMSKSKPGRLFIYIYYKISPTFVKLFGKTNWFKAIGKNILDKFIKTLQMKGYSDSPYNDKSGA